MVKTLSKYVRHLWFNSFNVSYDGRMNEEVSHRIGEARKVSGAFQKLWKNRNISVEAKVGMYEGIVEPTLLYGCEAWMLNVHERKKVEAVEMSCLRSIYGDLEIQGFRVLGI